MKGSQASSSDYIPASLNECKIRVAPYVLVNREPYLRTHVPLAQCLWQFWHLRAEIPPLNLVRPATILQGPAGRYRAGREPAGRRLDAPNEGRNDQGIR